MEKGGERGDFLSSLSPPLPLYFFALVTRLRRLQLTEKGMCSQLSYLLNPGILSDLISLPDSTDRIGSGPGGYSPKIPIRVCAAQRGRDFGTPYLERGIHFRDVS